jgi:hypothetical protein
MVDVRFETDYVTNAKSKQSSKLTRLFMTWSFGLIKTEKQAVVVQIIVACGLLILSLYLFSKSDAVVAPTTPPQELINTPQPTRPLN